MIDDDAGDTLMAKETIEELNASARMHITHDGFDAMAFLQNQPPYETAPRPDLILLDLNMPRMDGHEFLTWIKQQHELKTIPVVIFTTSNSMQDIEKCYDNYANCYVTKPVDLQDFTTTLNNLHHFWKDTAKLPLKKQ